jgi:choline-sulfatase
VPRTVEARSLVPLLTAKVKSVYPVVFGYFRDVQRMIRTDRFKLIHYPQVQRFQLFDLASDPHELKDLIDDPKHAAAAADLKARLGAWQKEMNDPVLR